MTSSPPSSRISLFYSYSHKDIQYKNGMETALSTLRRRGFIRDWSDAEISPGSSISKALEAKLPTCEIIAFLFSPDFLASDECLREWRRARELADSGHLVYRVPIIIRECAWQDFLQEDDVKALPVDGKAIAGYRNLDSAWQEVYEGIKSTVEKLRITYTARPKFLDELQDTELPSSKPVTLDDIFVFPRLTEFAYSGDTVHDSLVRTMSALRKKRLCIVHGEDKSGKTALAKYLMLSHIRDEQPSLFVDFSTLTGRLKTNVLGKLYEEQYYGDYTLWCQQDGKSLIIDNMSEAASHLDFLEACLGDFEQVYVFVSSDVFFAFFMDEHLLAEFHHIQIEPLSYRNQERLIRKRLITIEDD